MDETRQAVLITQKMLSLMQEEQSLAQAIDNDDPRLKDMEISSWDRHSAAISRTVAKLWRSQGRQVASLGRGEPRQSLQTSLQAGEALTG